MNKPNTLSALAKATTAWGERVPDWIKVLAKECDSQSQNKIAHKIGKSSAAISQVLKNCYPGTIANIETAVRANLMNGSHDCPIFGTILIRECLENQIRPFSSSGNPAKIRLFKACRNCQHNRSKEN